MHQLLDNIPVKPNIAEVRALVRADASSLLDHVTDDQIDQAIKRDIDRPAITPNLVAGSAISWVEFDVLCHRMREALADGSLLDYEPTTDQELRAFRRAVPPNFDHPVAAYAQEVAAHQFFLARRLITLATDIVRRRPSAGRTGDGGRSRAWRLGGGRRSPRACLAQCRPRNE